MNNYLLFSKTKLEDHNFYILLKYIFNIRKTLGFPINEEINSFRKEGYKYVYYITLEDSLKDKLHNYKDENFVIIKVY